MSEQDNSGSDVRASDAERDAVVARINQAVGEGRLTLDEFSDRLELAYAARTRGDLDPLLRDLPADAVGTVGTVSAVTSGAAVVLRRSRPAVRLLTSRRGSPDPPGPPLVTASPPPSRQRGRSA